MEGRWLYAGIASILSVISVFEHSFVCLLFTTFMLIYLWLSKKIDKKAAVHIVLLAAIFSLVAFEAEKANRSAFTGRETSFAVRLEEDLEFDGNKFAAVASAYPEKERVSIQYKIKTKKEADMLSAAILPGTVCQVKGALEPPNAATNPNAFDYRSYLKRNGIHWVLKLSSIDVNRCYPSDASFIESIQWWRDKEVNAISRVLGEESAGIAAALLFGERKLIPDSTAESYEKTGTVHLLAISGLHVTLVAGMLLFLLLRIGVTREHAQMLLMILLPVYAIVTGLAPPVNRAVIMLLLFLLCRRLQWRISPLDAISLAFLLLIFMSPYSIYDAGFQLTFAVSLALLLSSGHILNNRWPALAKTAAVSFIAQLSSLPILLYYFYEFSPLSILANMVFVPLYSFVILPIVLIFYGLFAISPLLAELLAPLTDFIIGSANGLSRWIASLPFSSLIAGKPAGILHAAWYISIICFFIQWEKGFEGRRSCLVLLPALPLVFQLIQPQFSSHGEIVFLDVGQGDSIFIRLPYGKGDYLIDTGGKVNFAQEGWERRESSFEVGKDVVLPFLKSRGVRKIDKLILTHGDADHIGGARAIIEELQIGKVLVPPSYERETLEQETLESAWKSGARLEIAQSGNGWRSGESSFSILGPLKPNEDKNEGSIIIWALIGGESWLFTGDLGSEGEEELLGRFPGLKAEVLKVGHHGSKHSSSASFIESLSPKLAVISAGRENVYGHPHHEVVERLEQHRIGIFRTDKDGAVIFNFRGKAGTFHTVMP